MFIVHVGGAVCPNQAFNNLDQYTHNSIITYIAYLNTPYKEQEINLFEHSRRLSMYLSSQYPAQPDHNEDIKHCRSNDRPYSHVAFCNKYSWVKMKNESVWNIWNVCVVVCCIFIVHKLKFTKWKSKQWVTTFHS